MTNRSFSDETLMAYADGELGADEAKAVELAVSQDPSVAARVEAFRQSSIRAKEALGPLLSEPVPDELEASVRALIDRDNTGQPNVVAFAPANKTKPTSPVRWMLPLAASVALAIGAAGGYLAGISGNNANNGLEMVNLAEYEGITGALNSVESGDEISLGEGNRFKAIATYLDSDSTLCREFEIDKADRSTVVAVACRQERAWNVQFTVVAGQSDTGYAPASSLEVLDAYLTAVGANEPMSPDDEAAALKAIN